MSIGLAIFTALHVLISLVAIGSGFIVWYGLLNSRRLDTRTALFLATTVATSVTGFLFPVHHFMPSHAVGIVSLLVLGLAIYARYGRNLIGPWRRTYVISAMISLYLNFFVLVAQAFQKVPPLKSLAPTGSEPPFAIAQLAVLAVFVAMTIAATIRFGNGVSSPDHSSALVA